MFICVIDQIHYLKRDFFNNDFSLQINFLYPFTVEMKTKGFDDVSSVLWS